MTAERHPPECLSHHAPLESWLLIWHPLAVVCKLATATTTYASFPAAKSLVVYVRDRLHKVLPVCVCTTTMALSAPAISP
jgi:hypothetical protein